MQAKQIHFTHKNIWKPLLTNVTPLITSCWSESKHSSIVSFFKLSGWLILQWIIYIFHSEPYLKTLLNPTRWTEEHMSGTSSNQLIITWPIPHPPGHATWISPKNNCYLAQYLLSNYLRNRSNITWKQNYSIGDFLKRSTKVLAEVQIRRVWQLCFVLKQLRPCGIGFGRVWQHLNKL